MAGEPRLKGPIGVTLGVTASLLLVAAAWSFVALARSLSLQGTAVSRQVRLTGREFYRKLASTNFRAPDGTQVLRPDPDADTQVYLVQAAVEGISGISWAVPPAQVPKHATRLDATDEEVGRAGDLWVYARRLPDRRTLLAFYDAPAYARMRDGFLLLATYEVAAVFSLLFFWFLLAWKFHRAYSGIAGSLKEAGSLLPHAPPLASAQSVPLIIQESVRELRRKTEELEAQRQRERQRAEDGEDVAKALCANLRAGFLRFDAGGALLEGNLEARRLLGLVEFPREGDREETLLAGRPELLGLLAESRESRELATRDEVPGAPGIFLQAGAIPLPNQLGQLRGHLLLLWDRTESYAMTRTLREREALSRLGEVSAGVAHEVRNALGSMMATLRLLREDHRDLGADPRYKTLDEEIRGLEKTVRDLLYFARPLPLEKAPVDAEALLEELAFLLRESYPGVEVEVEVVAPALEADREGLHRALLNLGRNAAEAALEGSPRPARVLLEALPGKPSGALFRVGDSGPGLGPDPSRLFEPFYSQKPGGTGLGLAIARKVAREHGGDLTASGEASPLGGALFELALP